MREVKAALNPEQMNTFKSALRAFKVYRSRSVQRGDDITQRWRKTQETIEHLFAQVSNGQHLLTGFTKFTQRLNA